MKIVGRKDIEGARLKAIQEVERKAEDCRIFHSAGGAGLTAVYRAKLEEAKAILAGEICDFHILSAEAQERGISAQDLSWLIVAADEQWRAVMGRIEAARFRAKQEISSSNCVASINKIAQSFDPQGSL